MVNRLTPLKSTVSSLRPKPRKKWWLGVSFCVPAYFQLQAISCRECIHWTLPTFEENHQKDKVTLLNLSQVFHT